MYLQCTGQTKHTPSEARQSAETKQAHQKTTETCCLFLFSKEQEANLQQETHSKHTRTLTHSNRKQKPF